MTLQLVVEYIEPAMIVIPLRAFFRDGVGRTLMAELTSLREQLKDLKARNDVLRGYL